MSGILPTTLHSTDVAGFDYAQVEPAAREALHHAAESIRQRLGNMQSDGYAIGRELLGVKNRLARGAFGAWIQAVIGITPRAAQNYMNVAKLMQGVPEPICETISHIPPAILYKLAAPSTPKEVVQEVVDAVAAGTVPSSDTIKRRLTEVAADRRSLQQIRIARPDWTEDEAKESIHRRRADAARKEARLAARIAREDEARKAQNAAMRAKVDQLIADHPQVMALIANLLRDRSEIYTFADAVRTALTEAQHPGAVRP